MARKEYDPALNAYQQAIALDHHRAAYHYNLYRATSQKTFISKKSDQAFQRARQLDSKLIDYYTSIDSSNMNRVVIDEVLSTSRLWQRILSQFIGREGLLFHLFRAWFENIPSRIGFLAPIFFLGFLIGMYKYTQAKRFLIRCPMCGVPTYRIYLGPEGQEFICFKCSRMLLVKTHPGYGEESAEVRLFQKNQFAGRLLSLFSSDSVTYGGASLEGFLFYSYSSSSFKVRLLERGDPGCRPAVTRLAWSSGEAFIFLSYRPKDLSIGSGGGTQIMSARHILHLGKRTRDRYSSSARTKF
jgi:hypothetical protein